MPATETRGFSPHLLDRLSARVMVADGDFDAGEGWDLDAATSIAAMEPEGNYLGRSLQNPPGRTARDAQVVPLRLHVSDKTTERFAGQEAELVPLLAPLAAGDVATAMRQWKALAEDALDDDDKGEPESSLHLSALLEGRWRLDGDLGALDGEMLATALRLASTQDAEGEVRTPAQRRAAVRRRGGHRRSLAGLSGLPLGAAPGAGVRLVDPGLRNSDQDDLTQPLQRPGGT
ncbi:MAG: hypothetical protein M3535_09450 [Actinomycetota bacterium]|nr:hypothetical protein [Actinomycetota bacterium]